jgi:hypothetical protein
VQGITVRVEKVVASIAGRGEAARRLRNFYDSPISSLPMPLNDDKGGGEAWQKDVNPQKKTNNKAQQIFFIPEFETVGSILRPLLIKGTVPVATDMQLEGNFHTDRWPAACIAK